MPQRFIICYEELLKPKLCLSVKPHLGDDFVREQMIDLQNDFKRVDVTMPIRGTHLKPKEVALDLIAELRKLVAMEPSLALELADIFWNHEDSEFGCTKVEELLEAGCGEPITVDCAVRLPLFELRPDGTTEVLP